MDQEDPRFKSVFLKNKNISPSVLLFNVYLFRFSFHRLSPSVSFLCLMLLLCLLNSVMTLVSLKRGKNTSHKDCRDRRRRRKKKSMFLVKKNDERKKLKVTEVELNDDSQGK